MTGRILPRFDFRVDIAADSIVGKVREKNEDTLLVAPELALFGVADGMGGLANGEVASRTAVEVVRKALSDRAAVRVLEGYQRTGDLESRRQVTKLLRDALEAAHGELLKAHEDDGNAMGTTLDVCLLLRGQAFLAHVGDSRAFLVRSRATLLLTEDHLVRDPSARPDESSRAPRPLASGLGLPAPLRIDTFHVDLLRGDTLLLATDGAYGPLGDEASVAALCRNPVKIVVEQLMKTSLSKGGRDNASCIALRIDERFVARPDDKLFADSIRVLSETPVFAGLPTPALLAILSAGVEVEISEGDRLMPFETGDYCAFVVLEGVVAVGDTSFGPPALLFGESLVGVDRRRPPAVARGRMRCLRFRKDDVEEITRHDATLGLEVYRRLATHLAQT
jgi:PPM family protein phosphatase